MAGEFVSASGGAQALTTWINPRFLASLERDLVAQKFTTKAVIPPGMGKLGRFITFSNAGLATSSLTEGTIGNSVDITITGVECTIAEEGEYMHVTRLQDYAQARGSREELLKRFRHGAKLRLDNLVLAQFALATTNIMYFTNTNQVGALTQGTFPGTPTAANAAGIIAMRKKVRDVFATGLTGIAGHPDGEYACMMGEQAALNVIVEATTGRMTWAQAVVNVPGRLGQEKWVSGYLGSIYGTACYTTQNISTGLTYSATNASHVFVTGDGGVGALAFEDMEPQVFVNTPGTSSTDNPYRNFSSIAWHAFFVTRIISETRVCKGYSAGS